MKFLVIDDSPEIVDAVALCLSLRWPDAQVLSAGDGEKGLELVEEHSPDLIILDIGLPGMNGLEVLRNLRGFSDAPVMMLTIQSRDIEIARFLEEGADEYVVKPFSHVELLGRLQAILRRAHGRMNSVSKPLQAGDLLMDFGGAEVFKDGRPISLTRTELMLLERLVRNATRVMTYEALAASLMQGADVVESDSRLIKVHIQHLRSKLGDSAEHPKYIANVYGIGYKFLPQVASGVAGMAASGIQR